MSAEICAFRFKHSNCMGFPKREDGQKVPGPVPTTYAPSSFSGIPEGVKNHGKKNRQREKNVCKKQPDREEAGQAAPAGRGGEQTLYGHGVPDAVPRVEEIIFPV